MRFTLPTSVPACCIRRPRPTDEQLVAAGIEPGMVRISVGLENVEDVIADLKQALDQI